MKKGLTELVFIIDRSGSMGGLEDDTIGGFNSMLREQQEIAGEAVVTTVLFDDQYELLHDRINIQAVKPLTREEYAVRGSTALLDALGRTIHKIRKVQRNMKEEFRAEKALFVIITDGHENASRRYTADMIRQRIEHQKKKYGWEFIFFGANMDAVAEAEKIGIAADRAQNYHADAFGMHTAYETISGMTTAFRTDRSIGTVKSAEKQIENEDQQSTGSALIRMKEALEGINEGIEEMKDFFHAAEVNGGKIPDVNEILRQVLSEDHEGSV